MESVVFLIFALTACGGAIAVVLNQNVVRMAFWLVVALGSTAGLFFLLGAGFVGATQLLIYVGGTVVLLIFGVMLTASGPYLTIKSSPGDLALAGFIGATFIGMLLMTVMQVPWDDNRLKLEDRMEAERQQSGALVAQGGYNDPSVGNSARQMGAALLGVRFDRDTGAAGETPSTGYLLPFEIASVHLLVVLVAAAYLARAKRRTQPRDVTAGT